ncbi:dihydrofolate reductase family protein [Streptomyces sp. TRM76323]|uniref:Dihydrofolate reductase family protein n=1 Tax=Streptomyces tamarix TaxID=3078565 RepID=A0ABU3QLF2_9ACTN|nr:dihydrofolate reductase family protein [Streptomyces tamarix]MDT9683600.1 dihydrofolate reductase family protein [Streptomyces tamarix]
MSKVFVSLGMSLDGFVAGPHAGPGNPLGDGGERLHAWQDAVGAWRDRREPGGGETGRSGLVVAENFDRAGAYVMGRRMCDEGERAWPDPPPFRAPVFVLTTSARDAWVRGGTVFTYVTDGVRAALDQARAVADGKDVQISGGAHTVRQYLNAGLVDELELHVVPLVLGAGVRLFDGVDPALRLAKDRVVDAPDVTHLRYRTLR